MKIKSFSFVQKSCFFLLLFYITWVALVFRLDPEMGDETYRNYRVIIIMGAITLVFCSAALVSFVVLDKKRRKKKKNKDSNSTSTRLK